MSLWRRIFDEKRRLIVPLLVAVVVNIAVYALVVYPMERRVATADARAEAAATARKIAERNFQNAQATVTGKDRADEELQRFYQSVLPANQTAARRITYVRLARMAREAGLRPDRGESVAESIRESRLSRLTTRMVLDGQYSEIRQFLHRIETSPEFTVIEDVKLDRMSAEDSALVLEITVSTYYWTNGNGD
jgi:Tfp pilus assembly protein PilO